MKTAKASLVVRVIDYNYASVTEAKVILKSANQEIRLPCIDEKGTYRAEGLDPGAYEVTVEAQRYQSDSRQVELVEGNNQEAFILGEEGMPYYYRGKVKVPFRLMDDLIALVMAPAPVEKPGYEKLRREEVSEVAKEFDLEVEETGENIARNGIYILRFPESALEEERQKIIESLTQYDTISHVGLVLKLFEQNATLLTNRIIVRFNDEVDENIIRRLAKDNNLLTRNKMSVLGNVYQFVLDGPPSYAVLEVCDRLAREDFVKYAEPDLIHTVEEDAFIPTDFLFPEQWDHQLLGTPEAWEALRNISADRTFGDPDVIIAVVDSGVDANHPEFSDNVTSGDPKIYKLFDFANMVANNDSLSSNHGTCCASAATALANNPSAVAGVNEGVAGVAGNCRLIGIRRSGPESHYAEMYLWAAGFDPESETEDFPDQISPGADVITNSFGYSIGSPISGLMSDTFDKLTDDGRDGKGVLLFFSAGNADSDLDMTFARPWGMYNRCFSVAASTLANDGVTEVKAAYSSFGSVIEFCAPSHDAYVGGSPLHDPTANYGAFTATIQNDPAAASHLTVGRPTRQTTLSAAANQGMSTIAVNSTAGLAAGQAILIGDPGAAGTEGHEIQAVNNATNQVTLNRVLFNTHGAGTNVYISQGDYRSNFGGTSHATPLCAGVGALMLSANPDLTWSEVRDILRDTAVKIDPNNSDPTGRWRDQNGRISTHPAYADPFFSEFYGYGRTDAEAAVKRAGWLIELQTPSLAFIDVPEGETTVRAIRFTVQSLWETGFEITAPPGTPFSTPYGQTTSLGPTSDFDTLREAHLWIAYTGTTDGDTASSSVTVRNPETEQEWTIPITANTVSRPSAVVMLTLDQSGSMLSASGISDTKRIDVLRFSANIMMDVIHEGDGVGIVSFDQDPHDVLVPPKGPLGSPSFFDPDRNALRTAILNFVPNPAGLTAIGDGVERAQARLDPVTGYGTKSVIVFTDGKETAAKYIADVADQINDRVFAVGLGLAENINPAALNALVNNTGGYLLLTGALNNDSRFKLAKYFLQILAGVKNEDIVVDPDGWIHERQEHRIPFILNEADITTDVILVMPAQNVIQVAVETPSGDVVAPSQANVMPGALYHAGQNVSYYRFSLPVPIGGGAWGGKWHVLLKVDSDHFKKYLAKLDKYPELMEAAQAHGVQYSLLVHAYSNLRMHPYLFQDSNEPGTKISLQVVLTEYGLPVEGRADVKATAIKPNGLSTTFELSEMQPGVFEGQLETLAPGIYTFRIVAQGKTLRGRAFVREAVRTGAVWKGGDRPFPTSPEEPKQVADEQLCRLLACLLSEKSLSPRFEEWLSEIGINLQYVRRCVEIYCRGKAKRTEPYVDVQSVGLVTDKLNELRELFEKLTIGGK